MGLGLLAGVTVLVGAGAAHAAEPNLGNSPSAHACQHGGWAQLRAEDGSSFANQGECVAHSALANSPGGDVVAPRVRRSWNDVCTGDGGLLYDDVAGVPVLGCAFDQYSPAPHPEATAAMEEICQAIGGAFVVRNEGWVLHVVCTPPA